MRRKILPLNLPSFIFSLVLILTAIVILSSLPNKPHDCKMKINVLVEPLLNYSHIGTFSEDLAVVAVYGNSGEKYPWVKSWKYGYININGELVIPCEYDYAAGFNEGLAAACKNGKYGFLDKTGNTAIPFEYDYALCFSNGLAAVRKNEKFGFINTLGETVIPFEYNRAVDFFYELTTVSKNDKYGIINMEGNIIAPVEYDYIYIEYDYGFFRACKDNKYGLMDMSGNWIVPCIYDELGLNSGADGLITVKQNGKWGY